jgi:hypothetical protein
MKTQQKALVVMTRPEKVHGLDELNIELRRGWRVVHIVPMGGAATGNRRGSPDLCFAALVILEHSAQAELTETMELAEEAIEEHGDGSGTDVADGL